MSLAAKIKSLRIKKNKSLQELADAVGASKAHIWDLETGRSQNPSIELLTALAKALDTSVSELIGENPTGKHEEPRLVRMYRHFKELSPDDQKAIERLMDHFKEREKDK